jgi:hypothetical protein
MLLGAVAISHDRQQPLTVGFSDADGDTFAHPPDRTRKHPAES